MKVCSIDTTLNEQIKPKEIIDSIDPEIAKISFNVIKKVSGGLDRKTLEKSHVLFIGLPKKKLNQELFIELTSYIDIGGCLILTLPSPKKWEELGRFFGEMSEELGISFQSKFVYGLPKISEDTRLVGTKLMVTKAHVIDFNNNKKFMKESGIKKYIPLALIDDKPVALAAYKRRGRFVVFSSPEVFSPKNKDFLNSLIFLSSTKKDYLFPKNPKKTKIGDTNFIIILQHACLDNYLLCLYHYNFMFFQQVVQLKSKTKLVSLINSIISKQKVLGEIPKKEEILQTLNKFDIWS